MILNKQEFIKNIEGVDMSARFTCEGDDCCVVCGDLMGNYAPFEWTLCRADEISCKKDLADVINDTLERISISAAMLDANGDIYSDITAAAIQVRGMLYAVADYLQK